MGIEPMLNQYSCDQPNVFVRESRVNAHLPGVSWIKDQSSLATSGIGRGMQDVVAAVGEFLERRHFFTDVEPLKTARLTAIFNDDECSSWAHALSQCGNSPVGDVLNHDFPVTEVVNLDCQKRLVPTAAIKIGRIQKHQSADFLIRRDTCGCSSHALATDALWAAVREQVERQSLLVFWLSGVAPNRIDRELWGSALTLDKPLARKLLREGTLAFFDITLRDAPGYAIACVFTGAGEHPVVFCPGLSYDTSFSAAVRKSFLEMWQNYGFLLNCSRSTKYVENLMDAYQLNFVSANHPAAADDFINGCVKNPHASRPYTTTYSRESVMDFMRTLSSNIYIYLSHREYYGKPVSFCKIFSPDFFLNLDTSKNCNLNNLISRGYIDHFAATRISKMVPFP